MKLKYDFEGTEFTFTPNVDDVIQFINELDDETQMELLDAAWGALDTDQIDTLKQKYANNILYNYIYEDDDLDRDAIVEDGLTGEFIFDSTADPVFALQAIGKLDELKDHFETEAFATYADIELGAYI